MDFILMLTRADQTIPDCLEAARRALATGVTHIGFKDVGVAPEVLHELNSVIKQGGGTSYLEVVSTTLESSLESARLAVELGVDRLLGGTAVSGTLEIISGSGIEYFPCPGRPVGHPSTLEGSVEEVAADAVAYTSAGATGVTLLAYRAVDADPLELVSATRAAYDGYMIVTGNIASREQIHALRERGVDGFIIGSAVFSGALDPRNGLIESQLSFIRDATVDSLAA